ncbi:MAG: hypothetical protein HZB56_07580 [Deltaproteobacteria bacterium]|nr:hypothetical protein [Deltaproteobacteria bacterium]
MWKTALAATLLALSAGAALAGDVTPYDKELAAQMSSPKKAAQDADPARPAAGKAGDCACKR